MKKMTALVLAAIFVFALFAGCGSKSEPAAAPAAEAPAAAPAAEAPAAAPAAEAPAAAPAEAPAAAPAAGDDFAEWKAYIREYVVTGAPTEDDAKAVTDELDAATTVDEVEAIAALGVMFNYVGVMHYNDWIAAGKPAADTSGMGTPPASGEATGEGSGEPSAEPAN